MCYDISFTINMRELKDYFPDINFDNQLNLDFEFSDHIIGHAYGEHPIIYQNRKGGNLACVPMEWGCIPFYVKEEKSFLKQRATMLNARSERILGDTKSYWNKIKDRRCLIPVSGTYEHREIKGWKKKVPYFVKPKEQKIFFLPGLYSVVEFVDTQTGEMVKRFTFTLITRDANEVMRNIHNGGDNRGRMPLFLTFELAMMWLKQDLEESSYKEILGYEIPSEDLEYYTVYTIRSSKLREDGKSKYEPWEWEKLPELGEMNPDPVLK